VAAGKRTGTTVLGTRLAAIPEEDAVGAVQGVLVPQRVHAGGGFWVTVRVQNNGNATWPASTPPDRPLSLAFGYEADVPDAHRVALVSRWRAHDTGLQSDAQERWLQRDLPPGEELTQVVSLSAPPAPGTYELEITLRQVDGARFDGPGNVALLATVHVLAPPAGP
jgi:hypothetical protein